MVYSRRDATRLAPLMCLFVVACVGPGLHSSSPAVTRPRAAATSPAALLSPTSSAATHAAPPAQATASTTPSSASRPSVSPYTWQSDGLAWTEIADLATSGEPAGAASPWAAAAAQGGGMYVAVGAALEGGPTTDYRLEGKVWLSDDGLSWRADEETDFEAGLMAAAPALGGVAVGGPLQICGFHCAASELAKAGSTVWFSRDGRQWQRSVEGLDDGAVFALAGTDELVLALGIVADEAPDATTADETTLGDAGAIWTSPDGAVWTRAELPAMDRIMQVAISGGSFVALAWPPGSIGYSGSLLWSDDGTSWTEVGRASGLATLASSPTGFLATAPSDKGYVTLLSDDGRDWVAVERNTRPDVALTDVLWIGDRWLGLGPDVALTSPDGRTWSEVELPPGLALSHPSRRVSSVGSAALILGGGAEGRQAWLVRPEAP